MVSPSLFTLPTHPTKLYIKLSTADIETSKAKLIACFHDSQSWSMCLKLNTSKTELIWFDRRSRSNLDLNTLFLQLNDSSSIHPSDVVRDLGVLLDSKLYMSNNIGSVIKACFLHLWGIRQLKRCLNEHCLHVLVQALVFYLGLTTVIWCFMVCKHLPSSINSFKAKPVF